MTAPPGFVGLAKTSVVLNRYLCWIARSAAFFVNDHNEGHTHVDQLEASSFGGTHPGRDGRFQTRVSSSDDDDPAAGPCERILEPGSVRSTIPFRSTGQVNQSGNYKIDDTDYDENLGN
jgi:hypothetical protein